MKRYFYLLAFLIIHQGINAQNTYKSKSILATGKWIQISAPTEGMCKVSYSQLTDWGISSPENVAVYSNGGYMLPKMNNEAYPDDLEKLPLIHAKDKAGQNAIFFYSTGPVKWDYDAANSKFVHTQNLYSYKTYFYLSSDVAKSNAPIVKEENKENADVTFTSFNEHLLYEQENINLIKSGRTWYSDEMGNTAKKTYTFTSPNVITSENAVLTVVAAAGSSLASRFTIETNNQVAGELDFIRIYPGSFSTKKATVSKKDFPFTTNANLKVAITYSTDASNGTSWLDYLEVNQKAQLIKTDQPLIFRNAEALDHAVVKYNIQTSTNSPYLWDITNPVNPISVKFTTNSNSISFTDKGATLANYVLFDVTKDVYLETTFEKEVANQNIHGLPLYDFIIITHTDFLSASQTLADYHRQHDQMRVLVLTKDEVYNEFSSGLPDVAAIRNMARMFYKRKTPSDSLRYLLLMGDGSYNNRSTEPSIPNYIPTYQSEISEDDNSYISDDFFVLLDDDEGETTGSLDIGIGRIPCRTLEEAELVVNKTINYTDPETMGDWRNVITFLADDEDSNGHMIDTEKLIDLVNTNYSGFITEKIYLDAYTQIITSAGDAYPEVTKAIKDRVEDGTLIFNYMGHANERGLAHENVLTVSDINSWSNQKKLPVFITATCEFSRYDDVEMSAGEHILFNPAGGCVALFSTSRVVYSGDNYRLSSNFYRSVFQQDKNGDNFRLGDIMRMAKNLTIDSNSTFNKRNFVLLGDPALQLAFPKYKVLTDKINQLNLTDTIKIGALDKVTIESEVVDRFGNLLNTYNGTVTSTVYDKSVNVQTLANDPDSKRFDFTSQNNIIYKGTSSVTNGKFEFSFIVPKDISYNLGNGKISYYVSDKTDDGNGSTDQFSIGGSSKNPLIDNDAPEVNMYLNNEQFRNNGKVSASALLLVNLYDESGINTVGTGIGHDITAVLDNDFSNPMILNDYYQSELNSYQNGKILYPLNNMEPGEHTLSIRVWDIQNNSTVKELNFIVEEGFEITAVSNFPNPVNFNTTFSITHNLPGDIFDTSIEIFNLRGIKIAEINEATGSYGSVNASVRWDVTDTFYPIDNEKILVYRVTLINHQGLKATGAGKLFLRLN
ncbi:MAG: type IX secretion system sortase PorU [Prolixibacteraceae bacterium]